MLLKICYRMISLVMGLMFLGVFAFPTTSIAAQTAGGRISYGDTVTGTISDDTVQEWLFRGKAGDIISLTVVGAGGDGTNPVGVIALVDELGISLADNNYAQSSFTQNFSDTIRLSGFVLPVTGSYGIDVGKPRWSSATGDYTLSLQFGGTQADPPLFSDKAGPIVYNKTIVGRLTTDELQNRDNPGDVWSFSGKRGDVIGVTLTELDLENKGAILQLESSTGAVIAIGETQSPVDSILLPVTGDYIIHIFGNYSVQDPQIYYSLSLKLITQNGDDGVRPTEGGSIEYSKSVLGYLNNLDNFNTAENIWNFKGKKGDVVSIEMRPVSLTHIYNVGDNGAASMAVSLFTAGSDQPLQDGKVSDDLQTISINEFQLPASGEFTINVKYPTWGNTKGVFYELLISPKLENVDISHGGNLEYGTTRGGEITDSNLQDKWTFQGTSGDQVTITMKRLTGNIVADFEILGPDGTSVGVANAAADRNNAELVDFELPNSGTYTVVARPFSSDRRGSYSITVTKAN